MVVVCIGVVLSAFGGKGAPLFTENFGSLADGTAITVNNTSLTYARVGTGTGAFLNARDPGGFSGASAWMLATSSSLTGLGVLNGTFAPFDVGTFSFSFHTPSSFSTANELFAFVGSGNMFSGNSVFNGSDVTAGFLILGGQLETRNSQNAWENVGSPLSPDTSYDLSIIFNGSDSTVTYGSDSVAGGKADVWLNGALWGDEVSIRDAVSVSAFRLYCQGTASGTGYEIDNIGLDNSVPTVPEPSAFALVAGLFLGIAVVFRKR